jgi:uncharacterized protein YutE (UPF0331/DUF86 family)
MNKPMLDNYKKALKTLDEGMIKAPANTLERYGIIQRFEYCIEISWKSAKKVLEHDEHVADTPRNIFRELAKINWIDKQDFKMLLEMKVVNKQIVNHYAIKNKI